MTDAERQTAIETAVMNANIVPAQLEAKARKEEIRARLDESASKHKRNVMQRAAKIAEEKEKLEHEKIQRIKKMTEKYAIGISGKEYPTVDLILDAASTYYRISPALIKSDRKVTALIRPRMVIYYLAAQLTISSFPFIGAKLGHRDHSTVWKGAQRIMERIKTDAKLAAEVAELTTIILTPFAERGE